MMRFTLYTFLQLSIVAMLSTVVRADGKYFRQSNVLAEPEIPSQRALIAFRDGVQTLVVESTVKGEGEALGWVLPLPNEPDSIAACSAGTLRSMAQLVRPEIKGDQFGSEWIKSSAVALVLSVLICLIFVAARQSASAILAFSLSVLVVLMCAGLLLPALGKARASRPMSGIDMLQSVQAGSYNVSVVRADSGAAIKTWLMENGFAFEDDASRELDRYVSEQWCFAAAKVRTSSNTVLSPHPLKVSFRTKKAIYPMRLTGLTRTPMQLDLYIIAEGRASTQHLSTWNCDQFNAVQRKDYYDIERPAFVGMNQGQTIGHPGLIALMWDDCVLTHLHATLTPAQMSHDLEINCSLPFKPAQHTIYSHRAALGMSIGVAMLIAAASAIILTLTIKSKDRVSGKLISACALMLSATAAIIYMTCDVQVVNTSRELGFRSVAWMPHAVSALRNFEDSASIDDIRRTLNLKGIMMDGLEFAGWESDMPLGYEVLDTEDGWNVTLFDRYAIPTKLHLSRDGVLRPLT